MKKKKKLLIFFGQIYIYNNNMMLKYLVVFKVINYKLFKVFFFLKYNTSKIIFMLLYNIYNIFYTVSMVIAISVWYNVITYIIYADYIGASFKFLIRGCKHFTRPMPGRGRPSERRHCFNK